MTGSDSVFMSAVVALTAWPRPESNPDVRQILDRLAEVFPAVSVRAEQADEMRSDEAPSAELRARVAELIEARATGSAADWDSAMVKLRLAVSSEFERRAVRSHVLWRLDPDG